MIYHDRVAIEIHSVWQKFPGLVWSNRNADDEVRIRAALTRARFPVLLELALVFGLERLKHERESSARTMLRKSGGRNPSSSGSPNTWGRAFVVLIPEGDRVRVTGSLPLPIPSPHPNIAAIGVP